MSATSRPAIAKVWVKPAVIPADRSAKLRSQPAPGDAEIGAGENDAGADDANTNPEKQVAA